MIPDDAVFQEAAALLDAHDYEGARAVYSNLLIGAPPDDRARAHALRGFAWYQEAHYAEAETDFSVAIEMQPNATNTLFLRARCREELDNACGALADYEAIIALEPNTPDAWEGASLIYRYLGRETEAEHATQMATSMRGGGESGSNG